MDPHFIIGVEAVLGRCTYLALFYLLIPTFLSLYNLGSADFRSLYQFNLETSLLIHAFSLNYILNY